MGLFFYVVLFKVMDNWLNANFYAPALFGKNASDRSHAPLHVNLSFSEDNLADRQNTNLPQENKVQEELIIDQENADRTQMANSVKVSGDGFCDIRPVRTCFIWIALVCNAFLIAGVIFAKYVTEYNDSPFFQAFQNCLDLKTNNEAFFSSKIIRDAGSFNIFFGLFLSHFNAILNFQNISRQNLESPENTPTSPPHNILHALRLNYDGNAKHFIFRLFVICVLFVPILFLFLIGPHLNGIVSVLFNVIGGLAVPFICGYWLRGGFFWAMEKWGVGFYQKKKEGMVIEDPERQKVN
jgi:hypothetical protein